MQKVAETDSVFFPPRDPAVPSHWYEKRLDVRLTTLLLVASLTTFPGCQLSPHAPGPQWLADFQNTDSLLIRNHHDQITISDAEVINRLRSIYADAKWKPYRHTLPGNLGDQTIDLLDGETKLRHFSYTGSLWETESYTENRTAELSNTDARWIESLLALVPEGQSPTPNGS